VLGFLGVLSFSSGTLLSFLGVLPFFLNTLLRFPQQLSEFLHRPCVLHAVEWLEDVGDGEHEMQE
jgi:hypothetical protein